MTWTLKSKVKLWVLTALRQVSGQIYLTLLSAQVSLHTEKERLIKNVQDTISRTLRPIFLFCFVLFLTAQRTVFDCLVTRTSLLQ